jgi:hypothetical protein
MKRWIDLADRALGNQQDNNGRGNGNNHRSH